MPKKIQRKIRHHDNDFVASRKQLNFFDNISTSEDDEIVEDVVIEAINKNELFEEKMLQYLDNAAEKSIHKRISAIHGICEMLKHKYAPQFLEARRLTIIDIIEKALKKGDDQEIVWSTHLAILLQLQIGFEFPLCKIFNQHLKALIQDASQSFDVRTKCCTAFGLLNFLGDNDIDDTLDIMRELIKIFSWNSCHINEKYQNLIDSNVSTFYGEAIISWGLLVTTIPSADLENLILNNYSETFPKSETLFELLKSDKLNIRMAAGELIALLYEKMKNFKADTEIFNENSLHILIDIIRDLATDSYKYHGKKDRKTQKSLFRDILRFLEDGIEPHIQIRFGTESLLLDSWIIQYQYTALCSIIGPGMNLHLQYNEFVREILGMEPVNVLDSDKFGLNTKQKITEKRLINSANFKARTIRRAKDRNCRHSTIF